MVVVGEKVCYVYGYEWEKIMIEKNKKQVWGEICSKIVSDGIDMVNGVPDKKIMEKIIRSVRWSMLKTIFDDSWIGYTPSEGLKEMRELVAERIGFNSNEILVTSGSQQAISLTFSVLARNRKVMVERYSYVGVEKISEQFTNGIVSFSSDLEKMDDKEIELEIKIAKPGIIYVVADFSNPKGSSLSINKRKLLSRLSQKYDFWIVEDQAYRDLYYDVKNLKPSMSTMTDRVVVVGSMSKIMIPGLRVGWLGAKNQQVKKKLVDLKNDYDLSSSGWNQKIAIIFLKKIEMLNEARSIYEKRMESLIYDLKRRNCTSKYFYLGSKPEGGFYYWLGLRESKKIDKFVEECRKLKLFITKGDVFDYQKNLSDGVRLSISNVDEKKMKLVVDKLFEAAAAVYN